MEVCGSRDMWRYIWMVKVLEEFGRGVFHRSVWLLARRKRAAGKRGRVPLHILSHSMEQSFLGKLIVTSSGRQEIPRILWDPKVYSRFHNSTPMVPTLSQILYLWYPSVIYVLYSSKFFFLGRLVSYISVWNNAILMVWTFHISIFTAISHFHQKNVLAWNSSSSLLLKAPDGHLPCLQKTILQWSYKRQYYSGSTKDNTTVGIMNYSSVARQITHPIYFYFSPIYVQVYHLSLSSRFSDQDRRSSYLV